MLFLEIEVERGVLRFFRQLPGFIAHAHECQARRKHQRLLRPGNHNINPPLIGLDVEHAKRGNGIHHKNGLAIGVFDIKTDEWGIDVVITGSQKALMLPPGLAFVSVSDKAWQLAEKAKNTAFYFNFKKEHENQQKNQTAYTPAVSLIVGLQEVLKMMKAEGLEGVFGRQAMLAKAMREGMQGAGLALFPKESPSDALTAISAPEGVDGQAIYKNLRVQYGMTAAGGQDHLKGKIFRLSHMGYMDRFDIIMAVAAVEMVLKGLGHPVKLGSGVAKAQEILMA